ncbi:MAG: radical SAM family heme chaperone HemW [Planctomycetaceae bacterium]|nr:radical SAM family heme chaperone HemW [Planctomycetaceae bacterium]
MDSRTSNKVKCELSQVLGPGGTRPVWKHDSKSVYVHIPFCAQRCGYCNFALIADRADLVESFLEALARELQWRLGTEHPPRSIETLFLGGGTPTFLSLAQAERLVTLLRKYFVWDAQAPNHEWSVEANPNDLTSEAVAHWSELGVTRFSLGVQSFRAAKLQLLERTHRALDIQRACDLVRQHGRQLSLDLIFAVGDETLAEWESDLRAAIDCCPQHLSTYQLTYEKGTQFWNRLQRGLLNEADQDHALRLYQRTREMLLADGFEHYEVSNFCRPGFRSRHNCVYWSGRPYWAFGPGAAGYIDGCRYVNHSSTTTYIKRMALGESPVVELDNDGDEMRAREYFVFGMRMLEGVDLQVFADETGQNWECLFGDQLRHDLEIGYFCRNNHRIQLTPTGLYISDTLWPNYLSSS